MSSVTDKPHQPTTRIVGGQRFDAAGVLSDLRRGLAHREVWAAFAWDEIQNRYRRSALGLAWLAISYLLFVFAIALFFGGFSALDGGAFVMHVAFGFAIFNFILAHIVDGCSVFVGSAGWVKSSPLPYAIYVYKGVARALFPLAVHLALAFVLMPFFGWRPGPGALLFIPAMALTLLTGIAVQFLFGLVAARIRDFGHFIQAVSRLLFFTTPILWVYEETFGVRREVANLNPMTHFVEMARDPLIGAPIDPTQWWLSLFWCAAAWATLLAVGGLMRRKLPFWV